MHLCITQNTYVNVMTATCTLFYNIAIHINKKPIAKSVINRLIVCHVGI